MKNVLKVGAALVGCLLVVDVIGFVAWIASGQAPADQFYIGTITAHIVRLLLF